MASDNSAYNTEAEENGAKRMHAGSTNSNNCLNSLKNKYH